MLFVLPETDTLDSRVEENAAPALSPGATSPQFDELLRIHEDESERFGQELHDSAGQLLVALRLSVARLKRTDADCTHQLLIDEIQETVERIDHEIRSLAFCIIRPRSGTKARDGAAFAGAGTSPREQACT